MRRPRSTFEFAIPPRLSEKGRGDWLVETIRSAIQSGKLGPGQSLPSTRELTKSLRLARGTIISAIERLKDEGYLKSIPGAKTFVANVLPAEFLSRSSAPKTAHSGHSKLLALSDYAKRLSPVRCYAQPRTIAFRVNLPALDLFPIDLWTKTAAKQWRSASTTLLLGGEPLAICHCVRCSVAICEHLDPSSVIQNKSSSPQGYRRVSTFRRGFWLVQGTKC
jgi:GntR family transcriptional regulator/MocR family aminotransferase